MPVWLTQILYLVSAVLFIIGIKRLGSPATARQGNAISGVGMLIAILVALADHAVVSYGVIAAGMVVGTLLGLWQAYAVKMTAMPQMVALLNGFGGGASMIVGAAEFYRAFEAGADIPTPTGVVMQLSLIIGGVTLTGSLVAFAKLQEWMPGKPLTFPAQNASNLIVFLATLALAGWQISTEVPLLPPFYGLCALALLLGVLLVIPIGGADMPVVISLLNSYSGIAAGMTGFVIDNEVLIIAGALVGSSGIILSRIMCKAMNRSLTNVLFGAFGATAGRSGGTSMAGLTVKSITPEDFAVQLAYARKVIIVPGYGMAVAQAQHQVRELADLIEKRGGVVKYAIHPVAGRMPGHMNVLLAEANIPYDRLYEMDDINSEFDDTDACLVIGANDVVNPAARHDKNSPIFGMPIINADHAKMTVVMKRSMATGFAGIENELFYAPRTWMLFGDAKQSLQKLIAEVKQA
ncbi:MAG: NAD(P)(+) transhydrogenase (Re/Si-specific) subunit beta [Acidobacteriota bacterium]|nr:NAD(P)(+) transhydrogenase (Re/Si-specific) subunit beta [Acidobacteriota bacterium]